MGRRALYLLLLAAAATAAVCCGDDDGGSRGGAISVVATTTQLADFARNVGGKRANVHQLLRANSDPHDFEPRPSDAKQLATARLVLESGGGLDGWLGDLIESAGGSARVVRVIDSVRTIRDRSGDTDPHWWHDPRNAVLAVNAIREALVDVDPGGRRRYVANARAYVAKLRRLDRGVAACMHEVPPRDRKLVTTHDALGYFAARYDVRIVGALLPSLSTQAQPSARDTERLVGQIRSERVKAIFPESALNPKLERSVYREAGARVGKALWADALGPAGSGGATYLEAMAANTEAMVDGMTGGAVSCRPPV